MKKILKSLLIIAATSIISACGGGGEGGGTPNGPSATLRLYPPISGATLPVGAAGSLDVEVRGGKGPYAITSSDAAVQMGLSDDNKLVVLSSSKEGSSDVVVYDSSLPVQQVKITVEAKAVPMASSVGEALNLVPNESRQINVRGGVRPYMVSSSDANVVLAAVSGATVTVVGQAKGGTATVRVTDAVGATLNVAVVVQVTTLAVTPSTVTGPAGTANSLNIVGGLPPYTELKQYSRSLCQCVRRSCFVEFACQGGVDDHCDRQFWNFSSCYGYGELRSVEGIADESNCE